jgi:hypothetical protein
MGLRCAGGDACATPRTTVLGQHVESAGEEERESVCGRRQNRDSVEQDQHCDSVVACVRVCVLFCLNLLLWNVRLPVGRMSCARRFTIRSSFHHEHM